MNEMLYNNISPREHADALEQADSSDRTLLHRRDFLIGAGAAMAATLVGKNLLDLTESFIDAKKITKALGDVEARVQKRSAENATKEQLTIQETDHDVIGKTFEEQILTQEEITLDKSTKKAIYARWHKKYEPGGVEYEGSLLAGLERMQPWIQEIKEIFEKYDIPEEFIYIGIAESHFLSNAVSEMSAVGPYQTTQKTAKNLMPKIRILNEFDERRDPIMSAEICAKHLRDSYNRFGDWELALMDYNGGFTNAYLLSRNKKEEKTSLEIQELYTMKKRDTLSSIAQEFGTSVTLLKRANDLHSSKQIRNLRPGTKLHIPQKREPLTMDEFNKWLERQINSHIKDAMDKPDYVIQKGDTISTIAQKFGISSEVLKNLNNIPPTENKIIVGQPLNLPGTEQKKRAFFTKTLLRHYHENINYPEKFYAISNVIKEHNLDQVFRNTKKEYRNINVPKINFVTLERTIRNGDTLTTLTNDLYEHLKKTYPKFEKSKVFIKRILMQQNTSNIPNENTIISGKKLKLNISIQKPATLEDIALKNKIPIEILLKLNPAAQSAHSHLPDNTHVRIPT